MKLRIKKCIMDYMFIIRENYVNKIASFLNSPYDLLRERSLNALGRIGRADFNILVKLWIYQKIIVPMCV